MKPITSLLGLLLLLLSGCATLTTNDPDWPASVPEKATFVRAYEADQENQTHQSREDYLLWIVRFFDGWGPFPGGWNQMVNNATVELDDIAASRVRERLSTLGPRIASHWAKRKPTRVIQNRTVATWAQVMQAATEQSKIEAFVELTEADVQSLIDKQLGADDISPDRYYGALSIKPISYE